MVKACLWATYALLAAAYVAMVLLPVRTDPVAVVVSPWAPPIEALQVVAAANGRILSAGPRNWIVLARSDGPDFVDRLYASGAWLVIAAEGLRGCGPSRPPNAFWKGIGDQ